MNRIRLLPEQVANQIAAGEVIERPASVVKELVENALDAQSTRIIVEIQTGGRSLIRVTDDGVGMSRDDALLSLERHATSKIQTAHDLSEIRSMGFRGEAVPSIASVSRMTLTTREREGDPPAGTQIVIHGGRILAVKEAGSAPGTCVEVRNLFFNLPARRKFLRSEETERAHIQHYLGLAALAFPEVAFTFLDDQRLVWQLPQVRRDGTRTDLSALKERLRGLYGAELKLLPVDFQCRSDPAAPGDASVALHVWGFIGAPGVSRATRDEQHLFVNRRPVENRGLNFALLEGYHTALMKGRYPVCCLFIEIDPAAVDVNIHPAKREVRFHQEHWVRRAVTRAVRETLLTFHREVGAGVETSRRPDRHPSAEAPPPEEITGSEVTAGSPPPGTGHATAAQPLPHLEIDFEKREPAISAPAAESTAAPPSSPPPAPSPRAFVPPSPPGSTRPGAIPEPPPAPPAQPTASSGACLRKPAAADPAPARVEPSGPVPLLQVPLHVLGVIGQLYVVLESDRGLVLLDQHAAHERILFEQMLRRMEQTDAPSQRLLLPETIELSARDAQFLRDQLPCLSRLGVGLSEFGERTFLLDALPPFVRTSDARRFVIELVDDLKAAGDAVNSLRLAEHTVAKTVCRHAVKARDPLSPRELEQLVNDLRQCAMPYTCPHGRPTLIEMNFRELEKKFGRAQ